MKNKEQKNKEYDELKKEEYEEKVKNGEIDENSENQEASSDNIDE